MSWTINIEEKHQYYNPSCDFEIELIHAISLLSNESNKIINASNFTPTNLLCKALNKAFDRHQSNSKSFVVIFQNKHVFPKMSEYFIHVPSLFEAIDYIYMEELERNL
jgi:hypothetical protein